MDVPCTFTDLRHATCFLCNELAQPPREWSALASSLDDRFDDRPTRPSEAREVGSQRREAHLRAGR